MATRAARGLLIKGMQEVPAVISPPAEEEQPALVAGVYQEILAAMERLPILLVRQLHALVVEEGWTAALVLRGAPEVEGRVTTLLAEGAAQ